MVCPPFAEREREQPARHADFRGLIARGVLDVETLLSAGARADQVLARRGFPAARGRPAHGGRACADGSWSHSLMSCRT